MRPITTKRGRRTAVVACAFSGVAMFAVGCGGTQQAEPRVEDPGSYDQQMSAELQQERQEFIQDSQERLDELEREMGQLQARIDHESQYVSESQQAEWKQELFELKREKEDVQQRLERARNASPQEWQAARSGVGLQLDRLEAGLQTFGSRVSQVFTSREAEAEAEAEAQDEREPVSGQDSNAVQGESDNPAGAAGPSQAPQQPAQPETDD